MNNLIHCTRLSQDYEGIPRKGELITAVSSSFSQITSLWLMVNEFPLV